MPLTSDFEQTAGDGAVQLQSAQGIDYRPTINNYTQNVINPTSYTKLVAEYKEERKSADSILNEIIAKIQHYSENIDPVFRSLEEKLKAGGFENDVQFAMLLKEKYTKYLTSNNLSQATQKIHAFLLARIYVAFNLYIPDAINEGRPNSEIKDILLQKIIQPVEEVLGIDNVLDLYQDDVLAMVYFLTGNCHIKWESNVDISSGL